MKTNNLLKLVKEYLDEGYFDSRVRELLKQSSFTDDDIDYLWDYVFKIQTKVLRTKEETLTIGLMKKQISRLIGVEFSGSGYNGSTVNKADMYKIYVFITSLPIEYLKDRLDG